MGLMTDYRIVNKLEVCSLSILSLHKTSNIVDKIIMLIMLVVDIHCTCMPVKSLIKALSCRYHKTPKVNIYAA